MSSKLTNRALVAEPNFQFLPQKQVAEAEVDRMSQPFSIFFRNHEGSTSRAAANRLNKLEFRGNMGHLSENGWLPEDCFNWLLLHILKEQFSPGHWFDFL